MRFRQKALAILTVLLLSIGSGFSGLGVAAASSSYNNPGTEFGMGSLHDKGYLGTRYSNSAFNTSYDFTLSASTPLWEQNGSEVHFEDVDGPALQVVSVKYGNDYFLYEKQGGAFAQVVPSSDTPQFNVEQSSSGGYPRIQVSLNAQPSFAADDAEKTHTHPAKIENVAVFFSGTLAPGRITIIKALEAFIGDPDQSFSFTIVGPGQGGPSRTVTVKPGDAGGKTVKVPYGTYYITENAQAGYKFLSFLAWPHDSGTEMLPDNTLKLVVGEETAVKGIGVECFHNTCYTVTCTNRKLGKLILTKQVDGAAAGDATPYSFTVSTLGFSQDVTLANGESKTLYLESGIYKVSEAAVPTGYRFLNFTGGTPVPCENAVLATVCSTGPDAQVTCNNQKLGRLQVVKIDSKTHNPVEGATFHITGPNYDQSLQTDASGLITLENLIPGTSYTVMETDPPAGYRIVDWNPATQTITAGGTAVFNYSNAPIGRIRVIKADAGNHEVLLDGAIFEICDNPNFPMSPTKLPATVNGSTTSGWLDTGHWWVREATPPAGYVKDDTVREVEVTRNETVTVTFYNPQNVGSLRVVKTSAAGGAPVANVTFELMDKDPADAGFGPANILRSDKTNANGEILYTGLPTGATYWVRETVPAPGYGIDVNNIQHAAIVYNQTVSVSFVNPPLGHVKVLKTDKANGNLKLAGAVYCVYSDAACTALVRTLPSTDANGEAMGVELPYGTGYPAKYYIKELTAPAGYLVSPDVFEVSFSEPGQTVSVPVSDIRDIGSVIIKKVDADHPEVTLAGAVFTLYSDSAATHQVGQSVTTGADGIARFDNLASGNYWIKETAAPEGYDLPDDVIAVTVAVGVTNPSPVVVKDNPQVHTGTMDYNMLAIGGGGAFAGGLALLAARLLRRKIRCK